MQTEDYLNFERYKNQPASGVPGFSAFKDDQSGLYYFSMYDEDDGSIILISEGYTNEPGRDNGIQSVITNRDIDEHYIHKTTDGGRHYLSLIAGNRQEIARTGSFDSEAPALALVPSARKKAKELAAAAFTKKAVNTGAQEDNYLHCSAYQGHPKSTFKGFTTFKGEETGLYYFAMVDASGKVLLRSEGYESPAGRDNGIQSVINNRDIKERWTTAEAAGKTIKILRAANNKEIGRSCPDAAVVVHPPVQETYAASEPEVVPESKFNWWWLLLPLLLLGFFAWKSCNKKPEVKEEVPVDTVRTDTAVSAPVERIDTMKPAPQAEGSISTEVNVKPIFFDFDKYDLRAESTAELDKLVGILREHSDYTAKLKAYTDAKGTDGYNANLSRQRARAAKDYVVAKGIDASRISVSTFGEKNPIAKNSLDDGQDTEEGRQFNRRVEIEVLKNGVTTDEVIEVEVPENLKTS